jgi:sugar O-acyltransferase (sialic acid O-acetyltransferase NeuD family)
MKRFADLLTRRVILWGGTGQAKVIRQLLEERGSRVVAVFDDTLGLQPPFPDIPIHYGWAGFEAWARSERTDDLGFCVTIGNPHGKVRLALSAKLKSAGLRCVSAVHPTAWVAANATVGEGCQIHAGAVIEAEARIGRQCIINTNASVDHECVLEDGVEIAPGATLCGLVHVGSNGWVCAGATVLPRRRIGASAVVGAGSVVIADVDEGATVVGVPASRTLHN